MLSKKMRKSSRTDMSTAFACRSTNNFRRKLKILRKHIRISNLVVSWQKMDFLLVTYCYSLLHKDGRIIFRAGVAKQEESDDVSQRFGLWIEKVVIR